MGERGILYHLSLNFKTSLVVISMLYSAVRNKNHQRKLFVAISFCDCAVGSVPSCGCFGAPAILPIQRGLWAHQNTHGWELNLCVLLFVFFFCFFFFGGGGGLNSPHQTSLCTHKGMFSFDWHFQSSCSADKINLI